MYCPHTVVMKRYFIGQFPNLNRYCTWVFVLNWYQANVGKGEQFITCVCINTWQCMCHITAIRLSATRDVFWWNKKKVGTSRHRWMVQSVEERGLSSSIKGMYYLKKSVLYVVWMLFK